MIPKWYEPPWYAINRYHHHNFGNILKLTCVHVGDLLDSHLIDLGF